VIEIKNGIGGKKRKEIPRKFQPNQGRDLLNALQGDIGRVISGRKRKKLGRKKVFAVINLGGGSDKVRSTKTSRDAKRRSRN